MILEKADKNLTTVQRKYRHFQQWFICTLSILGPRQWVRIECPLLTATVTDRLLADFYALWRKLGLFQIILGTGETTTISKETMPNSTSPLTASLNYTKRPTGSLWTQAARSSSVIHNDTWRPPQDGLAPITAEVKRQSTSGISQTRNEV